MNLVEYAEFLVKSIVSEPDLVKVQRFGTKDSEEGGTTLEVIVHNTDMGRVIGKNGKNANAIRTIIQAYAHVQNIKNIRVNIDSF